MRDKKNKNIAALLAFFGGIFGLHRFYLKQKGKGIAMIILSVFTLGILTALISLIDTIVFLNMDLEKFDHRYNQHLFDRKPEDQKFRYKSYGVPSSSATKRKDRRKSVKTSRVGQDRDKIKTLRTAGIEKFKAYDYEEAIEYFKKALKVDPDDVASNFNIACAYSQMENPELAMYHISKAVQAGFDDFERIRKHEKLAFTRIQPEWEDFQRAGFVFSDETSTLMRKTEEVEKEETGEILYPDKGENILEQLKMLKERRERGMISALQFEEERKKLMSS